MSDVKPVELKACGCGGEPDIALFGPFENKIGNQKIGKGWQVLCKDCGLSMFRNDDISLTPIQIKMKLSAAWNRALSRAGADREAELIEVLRRCEGELIYAAEKLPHSNARAALVLVRSALKAQP